MAQGRDRILFRRLESQSSALLGAGGVKFDPAGTYARTLLQKNSHTEIEPGIVIRSGCAGYDCSVKIGMYEVPCSILSTQTSQAFGVAEGSIPVEGTEVWVLLRRGSYSTGWIIGTIPRSMHLAPNRDQKRIPHRHYPSEEISPFSDNRAYNLPYKDKLYSGKLWSNSNRPSDILPGEYVLENENHVGMLSSMYSVELTGGNSFIRVDRIDDSIKVRSTNYTKWTNAQALMEFNDGGYISAEGRDYSYQGELLGGTGLSFDGYKKPTETAGKQPKPRTRFWKGFLGNLFSWFVVRPSNSSKQKDIGLASVHASQAGNIMVRSVGGVSLERYDRIPVPDRQTEYWSPEGDRETEIVHMPLREFVSDDPHCRALVQSSKMAWEQSSMYKRFDELKKDFKVPEEGDLSDTISAADNDPPGSSELNLPDYKGRRAGAFVGDDGSIILRDAWGSEIVMLGGNIFINTPGNIISTANRDVVSIARQSFVARGVNAAEVSSDESNVRIHAKKLVSIAGGTDKSQGGVLIESLAESSSLNAQEGAGDSASVGGVVIRSEKAGVSVAGVNTYVTAKKNVLVTGGDDEDTRNGNVFINGDLVVATGKNSVELVSDQSIVSVSKDSSIIVSGGSAIVAGRKSAIIVNDDKVPMMWAPADVDRVYSILDSARSMFDMLQRSDNIEPFTWNNQVKKALFSFRSSVEAKTNKGIEPWMPNKKFTMYQPWWQVMVSYGDPMASGEPYSPKVEPVHSTKSWPYADSADSGDFVTVESPSNLDGGYSIERNKVVDRENTSRVGMSEFKV